MVREEEYNIAKENRRKRQEAEEKAMEIHLPPNLVERQEKRKVRDRKLASLIRKVRRKH